MLTNLTKQSVPLLWHERASYFNQKVVDLKNLEQIDSAGIAFLVQWSKACDRQLTLNNVSDNVMQLLRTYNVEPLFKIEN